MKNVVVAQGGGPTAVINSTLRGIIDVCQSMPEQFGAIYGGYHGIEGVLREELLNLSLQPAEELALLSITPAAGSIGTGRYKLKPDQGEDFQRVLDVFQAHGVGYFFYIGGNDSMDTANKIARLARQRGMELVVVGAPKTVDNDLGDDAFQVIDHTPGYGSAARYWALTLQNLNEENTGARPTDPVLVLQAMGRKIGFIPAAARLADPLREMPLHIYLPEAGVALPEMADLINDELKRSGRCIAVVSEGLPVGEVGAVTDSFGHTIFSASRMSAAQMVVNYLNQAGLAARGAARLNLPGTDQRDSIIYASTVDLEEAYRLGQHAAVLASRGETGVMSSLVRLPGPVYAVQYTSAPLELVANSERHFPRSWIAPSRIDVTDDFVRYAQPLIGTSWPAVPLVDGRQRFARLQKIFVSQLLPAYIPQAYRQPFQGEP
jgi:ATP-dependent phosphofructokinase / diphosphate-dependent phosphofructokinase